MEHQRLLIGMVGLLVVATGGVFVLVSQSGGQQEIAKEALVAGVAVDEEVFEAKLQTEQVVEFAPRLLSPAKQPAKQTAPVPEPAPASQPSQTRPQPSASQPSSQLSPPPSPAIAGFDGHSPPEERDGGPSPSVQSLPAPAVSFPIDINTAGFEELQAITGIGPAIAQRIIDYRQNVSLFYHIEDIKSVSGIGDVTFEKMRAEITVGNVTAPSPPPSVSTPQPPSSAPEKININTASYKELQEITGVGEVIAKRIIDYRNQNGLFQRIEDIKNVKGIGDATFEKMKGEITT